MSWRTVSVSKDAKLRLEKNRLVIQNSEGEYKLPLEDIGCVILDSIQISVTTALLSELAAHNITTIICGTDHLPNGVLLPFQQHSRQSMVVAEQLEWTLPFKKRCWQSITKQKILNQANALRYLKLHDDGTADKLEALANKVEPGDADNMEATAAKIYFSTLFYGKFNRNDECLVNSALNYGYAIVRSHIAQYISSYGFIPSIGIYHRSQLNQFNLADDLIEPLRPFVDAFVLEYFMFYDQTTPLDKSHKEVLLKLMYLSVPIRNNEHSLSGAIDTMVSSLRSATTQKKPAILELPKLKELKLHKYE